MNNKNKEKKSLSRKIKEYLKNNSFHFQKKKYFKKKC